MSNEQNQKLHHSATNLDQNKIKTKNLEMQRKRRKERFFGVVTLAKPFRRPEKLLLISRQYPKNLCFLRFLCVSRFYGFGCGYVALCFKVRKGWKPVAGAQSPQVLGPLGTLTSRQGMASMQIKMPCPKPELLQAISYSTTGPLVFSFFSMISRPVAFRRRLPAAP